MLEGQIYTHTDGRSVVIVSPVDESIGDIYYATLMFGPLKVGVSVTEQGLTEAGFAPQEP